MLFYSDQCNYCLIFLVFVLSCNYHLVIGHACVNSFQMLQGIGSMLSAAVVLRLSILVS